jgi:ribosomal protein L32
MTDEQGGGAPSNEPSAASRAPTVVTCNQCGNQVPRLEYCIRCGDPLSDEYTAEARGHKRARFAAAPEESANAIALYSTLFPQLPHAQMGAFRVSLTAGVAIVAGLGLLGFFPVALVAAAVLVPLLMVLYLWVIDIYEDEPIWVIGATMAWGAVAGTAAGLVLRGLPLGSSIGGPKAETILLAGVAVPIFEGILMLIGPLLLLSQRRFNDVLDGATFGAASAVSFTGAQLIVQSLPLLGAGLRSQSDPLTSAVQLVSLGVLQPVIAAGAIGAVAAAFWLRYRAPITDRSALGLVGMPPVALLAGGALLVAAGLAKATLTLIPATLVLAVIAAVALIWLRRALHLGLMQESREIDIQRTITCPNCGRLTPEHTFCGNCGISLRAVPKSKSPTDVSAPAPQTPPTPPAPPTPAAPEEPR